MEKSLRIALFFAVILLASYLRIVGLTWGLDSGYGHYRNFQPDEFVSLRGTLQIDLLRGQLKAPAAYFEGTFNYYLWAVPKAVLELCRKTGPASGAPTKMEAEGHAHLLYICRWMSVLIDLTTIVIVFLAIAEATRKFYPSLLGALVYAVLPMQVIYAHFMRTHLLSNLLCALVIWLSLRSRRASRWWSYLLLGAISGLGAAARYPVGLIVTIPCLYLIFDQARNSASWKERVRSWVGPVWLIALGFALGLFIGHPVLFLNFRSVMNAITGETLKYASLNEFKSSNLLNLSVIWRYVSFLIPFAMYPFLWVLPYCTILYLCFRRSLYHQSLPILIFSGLYLYFMGKGYLGPYYARATMLVFPGFCILVGLACNDLSLLLSKQRTVRVALIGVSLGLLVPSIIFDMAYGRAMQQRDARSALREDLRQLIGDSPATIGVLRTGGYFYAVMPAVDPLKSKTVLVQLQDATQPANFFLAGFSHPIATTALTATIQNIEKDGNFKYETSYRIYPTVFGKELSLARFPIDMTYPFPTLLLFRGN